MYIPLMELMDIEKRISGIRSRLNKSTVGPWRFINRPDDIPCANRIESTTGSFVAKGAGDTTPWDIIVEDGEFIASSKEDVDFLLTSYNELLDEYKKLLTEYDKMSKETTFNLKVEI